jgi:tRNA pseudouridine32 synthase/23S rRNA pseudouridine746 synthase
MLGVLLTHDGHGDVQVLRAFSGLYEGNSHVAGWVPPIHPAPFVRGRRTPDEEALADLTSRVGRAAADLSEATGRLEEARQQLEARRRAEAAAMRAARVARRTARAAIDAEAVAGLSAANAAERHAALDEQSRRANSAARKLRRSGLEGLEAAQGVVDELRSASSQLRAERAAMSRRLTRERHGAYVLMNFRGDARPMTEVWVGDGHMPNGTGDCCAPKLLHYAATLRRKPLGMAEIWWGPSPLGRARVEGELYDPCIERCVPILGHLLCGVS